MAFSEEQYIKLYKKQVEKKFSFGKGNSSIQRNLEILSQQIEEKTGVYISLSTLKRLWKNKFKQSPQLATLNALAAILEFKDWQEFKLANRKRIKRFSLKVILVIIGIFLIITASTIIIMNIKSQYNKIPKKPKINGLVYFSAEKTVTSGIPNTVIFKYDVSNVEADSFFIQQTWNYYHRSRIDPEGSAYSSIYYESGYHRARLIANNTEIAMLPIHILSNGWEPHIYYSYRDFIPIDFKNEKFVENGRLHLKKSLLKKLNVDFSKSFFSRISNSKEFNVSSDNFSIVTRMKVDSIQNSICPWINQIIVTEKHIFMITLHKKGCEHNAYYKLGEIERYGRDHDLSALGCNVFEWQETVIRVKEKNAEISINGEVAFNEVFKEDFGKIVGLIYVFEGTGSIDYVKLTDKEGKIIFEDDFN